MIHIFNFHFLRSIVEEYYRTTWAGISKQKYSPEDFDAIAVKLNDFLSDSYYFEREENNKEIESALVDALSYSFGLYDEFMSADMAKEHEMW